MIYIGNGIYSNAAPDSYIQHYGVLGMKWGVRRAREHEKNIYRHNLANGMSKASAKEAYKSRMSDVKSFARSNRGTGMRSRDIANRSRDEARNRISNYDKKLRSQRKHKAVAIGLSTAALGAAGLSAYWAIKGRKNAKVGEKINSRAKLAAVLSDKYRKASIKQMLSNKYVEAEKTSRDALRYAKATKGLREKAKGYYDTANTLYNASGNLYRGAAVLGTGAAGVGLMNKIKTKNRMRK